VLLDTTFAMQQAMEAKLSGGPPRLTRLQKMIFGTSSEKASVVLAAKPDVSTSEPSTDIELTPETSNKAKRRRAQKGHGRNGAVAYTGAQRVKVAHPTLFKGAPCLRNTAKTVRCIGSSSRRLWSGSRALRR